MKIPQINFSEMADLQTYRVRIGYFSGGRRWKRRVGSNPNTPAKFVAMVAVLIAVVSLKK